MSESTNQESVSMCISNLPPVLYVKSHLFGSADAAVKLAERNGTAKSVIFAEKLLRVKNSGDIDLAQMTKYKGDKITKQQKYDDLAYRIESVKQNLQTSKVNVAGRDTSSAPPVPPRQLKELNPHTQALYKHAYEKANTLTKIKLTANTWVPSSLARFAAITNSWRTQVKLENGTAMPANQLYAGAGDDIEKLAIRSQYPKEKFLEQHCQMLLEQKVPVLLQLASDDDISKHKLPPYFRESGTKQYGDISVTCQERKDKRSITIDNLEVRNYRMIIKNNKTHQKSTVTVRHVTNWSDFRTINNQTVLRLVETVNAEVENKRRQDPSYSKQPLIHCRAGVGRTGVVAVAMQLMKPGNTLSVEDALLCVRATGAEQMVQTAAQYGTLIELENTLNR